MRIDRRRIPTLLALACALAACGGGGSKGGGGGTPSNAIAGTVTYDRVPTTDASGLAYQSAERRPVRGAIVQLYDLSNVQSPTPVGSPTTTDDAGHYSLPVPSAPPNVSVLVLAQTQSPPMKVQDNTAGGASYTLVSQPFPTAAATKDLHAPSGWTGASYGGERVAAPFAILDSMYTAARAVLAVRPNAAFAPLVLNWSVNNVPQDGDRAAGQIGTSHWDGEQLYILGAEDADTDEFDDHVIVHEWGHYFESTLSRSDSPGGPHSAGDPKDLRLAFGEGWGNAVSAMTLADPVYRDTADLRQSRTVVRDDMEGNGGDPTPGFFSERSVSKILYDLYDPANDDAIALGLGPIYDVMVGGERTTPALTSIYSFVAELKRANPGQATQIDALTQGRNVHVEDEWGTNDPNVPAGLLPLYETISAGGTRSLGFVGSDGSGAIPFNDVRQNWYFRLTGDGAPHTARTTGATAGQDIDLRVYHRGTVVGRGESPSGNESVPFTTQANEPYVIVVTGFGTAASYGATFTVQ